MIENLYADIGYQSLTKCSEFVCGDHIAYYGRIFGETAGSFHGSK